MYLVPIAWLYVALMMSLAEAGNSTGSVLGACITFLLYGLLPVGLVLYIMGTPARKRRLREEQQRQAGSTAHGASGANDAAPAGAADASASESQQDPGTAEAQRSGIGGQAHVEADRPAIGEVSNAADRPSRRHGPS